VDSMVATTVALYRDKARRERQVTSARQFLYANPWDDGASGLRGLYGELFKPSQDSRPVRADDAKNPGFDFKG